MEIQSFRNTPCIWQKKSDYLLSTLLKMSDAHSRNSSFSEPGVTHLVWTGGSFGRSCQLQSWLWPHQGSAGLAVCSVPKAGSPDTLRSCPSPRCSTVMPFAQCQGLSQVCGEQAGMLKAEGGGSWALWQGVGTSTGPVQHCDTQGMV